MRILLMLIHWRCVATSSAKRLSVLASVRPSIRLSVCLSRQSIADMRIPATDWCLQSAAVSVLHCDPRNERIDIESLLVQDSTTRRATFCVRWRSSRRRSRPACTSDDMRRTWAPATKASCSAMRPTRRPSACRSPSCWRTSSTPRSPSTGAPASCPGPDRTPRHRYRLLAGQSTESTAYQQISILSWNTAGHRASRTCHITLLCAERYNQKSHDDGKIGEKMISHSNKSYMSYCRVAPVFVRYYSNNDYCVHDKSISKPVLCKVCRR